MTKWCNPCSWELWIACSKFPCRGPEAEALEAKPTWTSNPSWIFFYTHFAYVIGPLLWLCKWNFFYSFTVFGTSVGHCCFSFLKFDCTNYGCLKLVHHRPFQAILSPSFTLKGTWVQSYYFGIKQSFLIIKPKWHQPKLLKIYL